MSARIDPLMTVDDLDRMPEDGNRYEVMEGELFVSRAPGLPHQVVSGNMFAVLWIYLNANPIGKVIATPGLVFNEHSGVIPDIVFFTHERAATIISGIRLVAAPNLVIEILSPGHETSHAIELRRDSCTPSTASMSTGFWIPKIVRLKSIVLTITFLVCHQR